MRFPGGARVRLIYESRAGKTGTVESRVFQRTVDYPDELSDALHVRLDDDTVVTVRLEQVEKAW